MAADDYRKEKDEAKRRRLREEETEREELELKKRQEQKKPGMGGSAGSGIKGLQPDTQSQTLADKIKAAETLMDQITSLYRQYNSRIQKSPPEELRKRFEVLVKELSSRPPGSPADQFRLRGFLSSVSTHRDQWDRWLKSLEKAT